MLLAHHREKLINLLVFFAKNTQNLGKIKLFKLLYLLDFEHFRLTGRSVTGLHYHAWKFGPVPLTLHQEWEEPAPDFSAAITIQPETGISGVREIIVPKVEFNDSYFSKRERRIMAALAEQYHSESLAMMVDTSQTANGAWAKIWQGGKGFNQPIPYTLSLPSTDPNRAAILEAALENEAIAATAGDHKNNGLTG